MYKRRCRRVNQPHGQEDMLREAKGEADSVTQVVYP